MTTISASKQTAVIYTGQASPQPWTITQMDPPETRWQPPPECSTPERYKFQISRNASTITVDGTSTMQQMRMYHLYKMGCGRDSEECCPEGWGWNGFYTPAWIPGGKMFTATPYVELGGDTTILDPQIWHFSTVSARVLCPRLVTLDGSHQAFINKLFRLDTTTSLYSEQALLPLDGNTCKL